MKSLLLTAFLTMGVTHTGGFLTVWKVPYVEDHFTYLDLARKLDKVFKIQETENTLRVAREVAAEKNYALYGQRGPEINVESTSYTLSATSAKSSKRK